MTRPPIRRLRASVGLAIADIDTLDGLLVVGSNLRREAPVLAHRVRKAAKRGAKIAFLNPTRFDYLFPVAAYLESAPAKQLADLAAVYSACLDGAPAPKHLASLVSGAQVNTAHRAIAAALKAGQQARHLAGRAGAASSGLRGPAGTRGRTGGRHGRHAGHAGRGRQCRGRLPRWRRAAS